LVRLEYVPPTPTESKTAGVAAGPAAHADRSRTETSMHRRALESHSGRRIIMEEEI